MVEGQKEGNTRDKSWNCGTRTGTSIILYCMENWGTGKIQVLAEENMDDNFLLWLHTVSDPRLPSPSTMEILIWFYSTPDRAGNISFCVTSVAHIYSRWTLSIHFLSCSQLVLS